MLFSTLLALAASSTIVAAFPGGYDYNNNNNHGKDYDDKKCYTKYVTKTKVYDQPYTKVYTSTYYKPETKVYETKVPYVTKYTTHKVYYKTTVITTSVPYTTDEVYSVTKERNEHVTKVTSSACPTTITSVGQSKYTTLKVKSATKCKKEDDYKDDEGGHYGY